MELLFLGTGSGVPAKHRNVSSIALKLLDERNSVWLFDCGEATQHQILQTTLKPRKIDKIFITHLHGDHIFGLPGLLSSRAFQGGDTPLTIYGPVGIKNFVLTSLKVSGSYLRYPLHFKEFKEDGILYEDHQFVVSCGLLKHGIASYGYRIVEKDHPGMLMADKLKEMGIPSGPVYGKLKKGETVELEDGRVIHGKEFIGPPKKGRVVTILGDTVKVPKSVELAADSDVLVHESTFSGEEREMAREYNHSTSLDAAETAKKAKAKKLLLNHISSRYVGRDAAMLEKEAKKIFPNTQLMYDFTEVDVPLNEPEEENGGH